jgi:hypothetical protein
LDGCYLCIDHSTNNTTMVEPATGPVAWLLGFQPPRPSSLCGGRGWQGVHRSVPVNYFFGTKKQFGPSSMSLIAFTPVIVSHFSLFTSPPSQWRCTLPPPLQASSPPCTEESLHFSTLEHAAFPRECPNVGRIFLFCSLGVATSCKPPHMHDSI